MRSRRPAAGRRWLAGAAAAAGLGVVALAVTLLGPWNVRLFDEDPVPGGIAAADETTPATTEAGRPRSGEPSASAQSERTTLPDADPEPLGAGEEGAAADRRETAEPPSPSPAMVEAALSLDRSARRAIQEGLAASGFDAGATDGLFGARTRRALREWQSSRGVLATGYLNAAAASELHAAGEDAARVEAPRLAQRDAALAPGAVFRDCPSCPELVVIPAGEFQMGSPAAEEGRRDAEGPQRRVRLERFALGRNEVTRAEYAAFAAATRRDGDRCYVPDGNESWGWVDRASWRSPGFSQSDEHPAVCVSWDDARAYARWLSDETGRDYRLPSEAEWEYAARAGTSTSRYWGDGSSSQCGYANGADAAGGYRSEHPTSRVSCNDGRAFTAPVGTFAGNRFGIFDMLGNVWEMVEDCWHDSYSDAPSEGRAWTSGGDCSRRVSRGGSWRTGPRALRAAHRSTASPSYRDANIGLRVARTLD